MLRPIKDFVVIKRAPKQDKTEGGIYIPGSSQEKVTRGVVMAVGPGDERSSKVADGLERAIERYLDPKTEVKAGDQELVEHARMAIQALRSRRPQVQKGDEVLFGKYTGNEARVRDEDGVEHDCVLCRDDEIFGVIE